MKRTIAILLPAPRAVEILLPLLEDTEINYHAAWALGEVGDPAHGYVEGR
jgi:HEAT repeat protein